jgi:Spy/CpxP family protein refolding chaperone
MKKEVIVLFFFPFLAMAQPVPMKEMAHHRMGMCSFIGSLSISDEKAGKLFITCRNHMKKMEEIKKNLMETRDKIEKALSKRDEKELKSLVEEMEKLIKERQDEHTSFMKEVKSILSPTELAEFYVRFAPFPHFRGMPTEPPANR